MAAKFARLMHSGGPDYFGEVHTLMDLGEFLRAKGVSDDLIESEFDRLNSADFDLDVSLADVD